MAQTAPSVDRQTLTTPGLDEAAEIIVDQWGIPHIYAATIHDAFFAQGCNAARDRLWQIDLWRKRGLGLLSESFGPAYVAKDRAARLFLYRGELEAEWAAYGPDAKAWSAAFVAGINAYIELVRSAAAPLPVEFRLTNSTPDLWEPTDLVRIRSHGLNRNAEYEAIRARVVAAADETRRLTAEMARIDTDLAREGQIVEDAGRALARLEAETSHLEGEAARMPERLPGLRAASEQAEVARGKAEAVVEALASEIAAAEAHARGVEARVEHARLLLARTLRALTQAQSERQAIGPLSDPARSAALEALAGAQDRLREARKVLDIAEESLAVRAREEGEARDKARAAEDSLARLVAEARGLASAAASPAMAPYTPALDLVSVPPGIEAALAAALGDDLEAPVDLRAARFWGGREAGEPPWPAGVAPLGRLVSGPSQLAARLAFTGLVERDQGSRLQPLLPPGTRIVSLEGDLWRWDGFVCRAEAPRPSQVRLEQKARLAGMLRQIEALSPAVEQARELHARAAEDLVRAQEAARLARDGPLAADRDVTQARDSVEALEREGARRESRAQSLDETIARFGAERDEAITTVASAEAAAAEGPSPADKAPLLADARGTAAKAREAAAAARAALGLAVHERDSRQGRLEALRRDRADWSQRAAAASERQASLAKGRALAAQALAAARTTPAAIEARRATLLDDFATAEARQARLEPGGSRPGRGRSRIAGRRCEGRRRSRGPRHHRRAHGGRKGAAGGAMWGRH